MPKVDLQTILKTNDLTVEVQRHLFSVYTTLLITILCCCFGVYLNIMFGIGGLMSFILSFGVLIWIQMDQDKLNYPKRTFEISLFGTLQGISIGPLIKQVADIDNTVIYKALICTSIIFASFSISALVAKRRSYIYLTGFLTSSLLMFSIMGIMNIFYRSSQLYDIYLFGSLFVFSGFVIVDTQIIIEKTINGSRDVAGHAVSLFLDALNIFIRILIILSKSNKGGNNHRNDSEIRFNRMTDEL
jgi:FtsH-binding integral membrane protein